MESVKLPDKIPADKKGAIETACGNLKKAVQEQNLADIDRYMPELEAAWHAASEDMAKATQQGPSAQDPNGPQNPQGPQGGQSGPGPDFGN